MDIVPTETWEGAGLKMEKSIRGEISVPVNQVRDPYIFEDTDEKMYTLYAGAGEQNICFRQLSMKSTQ